MNMVPIQVTQDGIIIPRIDLPDVVEVEVEITAEYVIVRPKNQPAKLGEKTALRDKPIRIYSPRLANRKRATDFRMEVKAKP